MSDRHNIFLICKILVKLVNRIDKHSAFFAMFFNKLHHIIFVLQFDLAIYCRDFEVFSLVHVECLVAHHVQKPTLKTILFAVIRSCGHAYDPLVVLLCVLVELDGVLENHIVTLVYNDCTFGLISNLIDTRYVLDACLDLRVSIFEVRPEQPTLMEISLLQAEV
jgi:hypothetical protein